MTQNVKRLNCPHCQCAIDEPIAVRDPKIRSLSLVGKLYFCPGCYNEIKYHVPYAHTVEFVSIALVVLVGIFFGMHALSATLVPSAVLVLFYVKKTRKYVPGKRRYSDGGDIQN